MIDVDSTKREFDLKYRFDKRSYEAGNSMGAKVTVEETDAVYYNVTFSNFKDFPITKVVNPIYQGLSSSMSENYAKDVIVGTLNLDIPKARDAKENLRVLIVGKLAEPFVWKGVFLNKATMSKPKESFAQYFYVHVQAEEMWLFNYETGEIYQKIKRQ